MIDLNEAAKASLEVLKRREANGAASTSAKTWQMIKQMASNVIDVSEAYDDYLIRFGDKISRKSLASGLANVIISALCFAAEYDVDIDKAVQNKMRLNERRVNKQGDKL